MSLEERFQRYGSPSNDWNETIHIYQLRADTMTNPDDIARRDKYAAEDIKRFEAIVADLRTYRQELQKRYAELETMSFKRVIRLERVPSYGGGVAYYIRFRLDYEDGTAREERFERFEGRDRAKALKRFEELKKQAPGASFEADIARRSWERR